MIEFQKQLTEIKNLPILRAQLQARIKAADNAIESIRCVFGYKDRTVIYPYTAFDFLDNYQDILGHGQLEKFYIYQLIQKKSIR